MFFPLPKYKSFLFGKFLSNIISVAFHCPFLFAILKFSDSPSKKFDTIEDFYRFYGKTIRWKPETHNHIIELVKWANEHNILCTTIANFVIDHKWEELEALKNEGGVNYDSMRLL